MNTLTMDLSSFSTKQCFLHNKARDRLTTDKADMQAFVFMNERVLERLADQSDIRK